MDIWDSQCRALNPDSLSQPMAMNVESCGKSTEVQTGGEWHGSHVEAVLARGEQGAGRGVLEPL